MVDCIAIFGSIGLMVIVALVGWLINRRNAKEHVNDGVELIKQFIQWNETLTTKKALLDFYGVLSNTCSNAFGCQLKLNITQQEFDQLSIDSIKMLNNQALEDLMDEICNKSHCR